MGVLRSTWSYSMEIVCEGSLQDLECIGSSDSDRAEMRDIENNCAVTARSVFGEGSVLVRKRHVPTAKRHHFGADRTMDSIERRKAISHDVTLVSKNRYRSHSGQRWSSDRR
jgi:hypothetical protein